MWNSQKIKKRVKNVIIKSVSYESLSSINLVFDSSTLNFGKNVKYGLLSRHLFQIKQQCGCWKNLKVATNFCEK